jgi:hypothetical protein
LHQPSAGTAAARGTTFGGREARAAYFVLVPRHTDEEEGEEGQPPCFGRVVAPFVE